MHLRSLALSLIAVLYLALTACTGSDVDQPTSTAAARSEEVFTTHGDEIRFRPAWRKGDRFNLEIEPSRSRPPVLATPPLKLLVEVTVLEATKDGFLVEWLYRDFQVSGAAVTDPTWLVLKGLREELILAPSGNFLAIRNWQEVRDLALKTADAVFPQLSSDPRETAAARQLIESIYQSQEQVKSSERYANAYFGVLTFLQQGLYRDESTVFDSASGTTTISLADYRPHENVELSLRSVFTEEYLRRFMGPYISQITSELDAAGVGRTPLAGSLRAPSLVDEIEIEFDVQSGWPERVTYVRRSVIGDSTQLDRIVITRKP